MKKIMLKGDLIKISLVLGILVIVFLGVELLNSKTINGIEASTGKAWWDLPLQRTCDTDVQYFGEGPYLVVVGDDPFILNAGDKSVSVRAIQAPNGLFLEIDGSRVFFNARGFKVVNGVEIFVTDIIDGDSARFFMSTYVGRCEMIRKEVCAHARNPEGIKCGKDLPYFTLGHSMTPGERLVTVVDQKNVDLKVLFINQLGVKVKINNNIAFLLNGRSTIINNIEIFVKDVDIINQETNIYLHSPRTCYNLRKSVCKARHLL